MAFLAVFAVVCLFSSFAPYSPEPRFGVGVSQPVSHAEIYRNWAISQWPLAWSLFSCFYCRKTTFSWAFFFAFNLPLKNRIEKIVPGISSISIPCLINNLINSCAAESFTHKGSYQVSIPKSGGNLGLMQRHVYLSKNRST